MTLIATTPVQAQGSQDSSEAGAQAVPVPTDGNPNGPWISPNGQAWVAFDPYDERPAQLTALDPATGAGVFTVDLPQGENPGSGAISDVTFDAAGNAYAAVNAYGVVKISATGTLVAENRLEEVNVNPGAVEFGADGRLYVGAAPNPRPLLALDASSLAILAQGPPLHVYPSQFVARSSGLVNVESAGASFLDYSDISNPTTVSYEAPVAGSLTFSAVSPSGIVYGLMLQGDPANGGWRCDDSHVVTVRPDGSSATRETAPFFADLPADQCQLADIEALPAGGAAIVGVAEDSTRVVWLNTQGEVVGTATRSFASPLEARLTDVQSDGAGTLSLATTVTTTCPAGPYVGFQCSQIELVGYTTDRTPAYTRTIDGGGGSVQVTSGFALSEGRLHAGESFVVVTGESASYYCGTGCAGPGNHYTWFIAAAPVVRRAWEDPATAAPPEEPPDTFKYVALGDSFSAGEGIEPFIEGPEQECHRSELAYPTKVQPLGFDLPLYQLKDDASAGVMWGFQACSGAEAEHVLKVGGFHGEPYAQLAKSRDNDPNPHDLAVDENTDLVTITVGGNDAGFNEVLTFCWKQRDCHKIRSGANGTYADQVAAQVEGVRPRVRAVYEQLEDQAPNALIIVLGYPQLFPESEQERMCTKLRQHTVALARKGDKLAGPILSQGYSIDEQQMFRNSAVRLNEILAEEVERIDSPRVLFVSVLEHFAGHEVCGDGDGGEWINGPTASLQFELINDQSFHPTARGQAEYARCVNAVFLSAGRSCEPLSF